MARSRICQSGLVIWLLISVPWSLCYLVQGARIKLVRFADSFVGVSGTIGSASKIVSPDKIGDHIEDLFKIDSVATEKLRERISREVKDQETAEKLKPWYGTWCKRPTFHDDYLPTFNHENVPLVDTDGKGLESLTEKASSLMESSTKSTV